MVDALGMEMRHPAFGLLVVFARVDVEEWIRGEQVTEDALLQHLDPDPIEQLQDCFVPRHEHSLDGSDTSTGIDSTQSLLGVVIPGNRDVRVARRGSLEHPVQDLWGQEGKVNPQDQALLESGMAQTREDPAERSRLADLIGVDGNVQEGENLGRPYDEDIFHERGKDLDGAIHEAFSSQGQESLVGAHPPAPAAGEDETTEAFAGLHGRYLPRIIALVIFFILSHP